jgi:hypothetical protein
MFKRTLAVLGAAALLTGLAIAPASAAAEKGYFTLDCANGSSYEVETNGAGQWTPARDLNGNRVFVPIAFSDFTFTAYVAGTNEVLFSESDPTETVKTAPMTGRSITTCSGEQRIEGVLDEDLGPIDLEISLTVTVATTH